MVILKYICIGLLMLLIILLDGSLAEENYESSFLTKLREISGDIECFPVDFIACRGPLSFYNIGKEQKIVHRQDLDWKSFYAFYEYCTLSFNATEEDIEECFQEMDKLPAKEQALGRVYTKFLKNMAMFAMAMKAL